MGRRRQIGRTLRTRYAPWLVWIATMSGAGWLWYDGTSNSKVMGYVRGVEYKVAAVATERIESLAVEIGQKVQAGQVLAILDGKALEGKIAVTRAEVALVDAQRTAAKAKAELDRALLLQRLDEAAERVRLALVKVDQVKRVKGAELRALRTRRKQIEKLLKQQLTTRDGSDGELAVKMAGVREQVGGARPEAALLQAQLDAVQARRARLASESDFAALLAPFEAKKMVLQRKLEGYVAQRARLVVRAPATGRVAEVLLRRGEVAAAGMTLVKVIGDDSGKVVACLDERRALAVTVGDKVEVRSRGAKVALTGAVQALSPKVGALPLQCRPDPRNEAWGREVIVKLDQPAALVPGQRFVVAIDSSGSHDASATARAAAPSKKAPVAPPVVAQAPTVPTPVAAAVSPPRDDGDLKVFPKPLVVPAALAAQSRFEPSGIVWVKGLDRYLIVSDDTGHKSSFDDAPWVFSMTRTGAVDAVPLPVSGVKKWSDLEGVAPSAAGVYVIASNSSSKKGNRPKKRQVFTHIALAQGGGLVGRAPVRLHKLLRKASEAERKALGVGGAGLDALNIEGLAAHPAGGLLIGLKSPLDAQGRAQIWHLRHPDKLLSGADLATAQLSLWGTVPLTVTDGNARTHQAGIADLLILADGSLLVGATPSNRGLNSPAGALWAVTAPQGGRMSGRLLQTFDDGKPEGLALSATSGNVVIVFDRGDKEPAWAELAWPQP